MLQSFRTNHVDAGYSLKEAPADPVSGAFRCTLIDFIYARFNHVIVSFNKRRVSS